MHQKQGKPRGILLANWGTDDQEIHITSPTPEQLADYIDDVGRTWQHDKPLIQQLSHACIKMPIELAELEDHWAKYINHDQVPNDEDIIDELGDFVYYLVAALMVHTKIATQLNNFKLSADQNQVGEKEILVLDMNSMLGYNVSKRENLYPKGYSQQMYEQKEKEKRNGD